LEDVFELDVEKVLLKKTYKNENIPADYDPYKKVREALKTGNVTKKNLDH
jgi:hypothetical protein